MKSVKKMLVWTWLGADSAPGLVMAKTLKIGSMSCLTGQYAADGNDIRQGVEIAIAMWEAKGGVPGYDKIEYEPQDSGCDGKQAVSAANKLVNLGVAGVKVFIMIGSVVLMIGLNLFVKRTRLGKAMRSTAQNRPMSAILGINANKTIVTTFMIGASLAAAAGVMVGLYYGSVRFDMGFVPGIKAFAAAVLGGIGNLTGAMLGGLIIGIVVIFAAGYLASEYKDVFAFIILILVLYFRPTGIMGEQVDDTRV